jgi:hypothetical protein
MENTKITCHLNEKITKGENLIYCSTMQLAWNELCDFVGGDIVLPNGETVTETAVKELNKRSFKKTDLDPKCYIALAGLCKNGIVDKIKGTLKQNFNEMSKCNFSNLEPTDIIAYAFLLKILEFEQKFEKIDYFEFMGKPVEAFGIEEVKSEHLTKLTHQVKILHYESPSEFTLSIKTKQKEFITLARLQPGDTFKRTLANLEIDEATDLRKNETLQIPKISFDLEHHFDELKGNEVLISKKPKNKETGYYIDEAVQFIKFDLDECGAKLRSEAMLTMRYAAMISREAPRKFIFDEPFLIILRQTEDSPPYFAAWIENTEVLKERK